MYYIEIILVMISNSHIIDFIPSLTNTHTLPPGLQYTHTTPGLQYTHTTPSLQYTHTHYPPASSTPTLPPASSTHTLPPGLQYTHTLPQASSTNTLLCYSARLIARDLEYILLHYSLSYDCAAINDNSQMTRH